MQDISHRTIDSKPVRALVIMRALPILGRLPCGCPPVFSPCNCQPACCKCDVEIVLCDCVEDWRECEAAAFVERLGAFYLAVDPWNYSPRPDDSAPMMVVSRAARLNAMADRWGAGLSVFGESDLRADGLKVMETLKRTRNGESTYSGNLVSTSDDPKRVAELQRERYLEAVATSDVRAMRLTWDAPQPVTEYRR